jgi:hypothetical protein
MKTAGEVLTDADGELDVDAGVLIYLPPKVDYLYEEGALPRPPPHTLWG